MNPTPRQDIILKLVDVILSLERPHPLRVAIDGVDGSGKTCLADELVVPIRERNRPVIRASIDGFHKPREVRYQRGVDSPTGYYYDSFDYDQLQHTLLNPLGLGGDRRYLPAVYDYREELPVEMQYLDAPPNAILLFDGVFLLRPCLFDSWDFSIFVDASFEVSVQRAVTRDSGSKRGDSNTENLKYERRYVPGQQIYLHEVNPREKAHLVFINNDLENPSLILNSPCTSC